MMIVELWSTDDDRGAVELLAEEEEPELSFRADLVNGRDIGRSASKIDIIKLQFQRTIAMLYNYRLRISYRTVSSSNTDVATVEHKLASCHFCPWHEACRVRPPCLC
eukprot:COSAG05_NODE_8358_length_711_cov_0.947712_2_plen_107_part_00